MSGHSKWATIHRQKETKDAKRGQLFSKIALAIALAARQGGVNPDTNLRLRMVLEKARAANMPKENIERALRQAEGKLSAELQEMVYEGYGPLGVAVVVEAATDNRNRTGQEIKNIFERAGGALAGPGSVSFNFEQKGLILVEKGKESTETMLSLIDLGVEEIEETDDAVEVFVEPNKVGETRDLILKKDLKVISSDLILSPKQYVEVDKSQAPGLLKFLTALSDQADVQKVWANADIAEEAIGNKQ